MAITGSPRLRLRLAVPRSQLSFRRGQDSGDPWIEPGRLGERPTDRLEHGLGDVVEIVAVVHGHVQRHLGAHAVPPPSVRSRRSAALPCPARPSTRVRVLRCGAAARSPPGEYSMTLDRFTKSSVPSGDANRAVPAVGSTWS